MSIDHRLNSSNILAMVSGGISATDVVDMRFTRTLTFLERSRRSRSI